LITLLLLVAVGVDGIGARAQAQEDFVLTQDYQ
jgi:hypothetical protein